MNSERNVNHSQDQTALQPGDVVVKLAQIQTMRQLLHELANIFTGLTIAGGLLSEQLEQTSLGRYASGLYNECERGRWLVRELSGQLAIAAAEQAAPAAVAQVGLAEPGRSQPFSGAARDDGDDHDRRQR